MTEYHFNVEAARRYGVDEAIFLHSLAFWVEKNRANDRNLHDGRCWTYNTQDALAKLFPFWTRRQVERIITSCKDQGAVLTGNYNEDKTVRTKWYALGDAAHAIYFETKTVECIPPNGEMVAPQGIDGNSTGADPISPNGEMHSTERGNPYHETVECNKDTVTYPVSVINTPYSPPREDKAVGRRKSRAPKSEPTWKPERFERFWDFYPRGEDRVGAVREWDKLRPDDALIDRMALSLAHQKATEDWRSGIGIPYACRWLKNRRWEDGGLKPRAVAAGEDGEWIS